MRRIVAELLLSIQEAISEDRANQFFKLDGLVEMVTRRVSEDLNGFLANASGYHNTQFQKLICPIAEEGD